MNDARPYASLSSGLLARKGTAKPAMRPQGYGGFEDLGWNDMGHAPGEERHPPAAPEHVPSSIAALTPAPKAGRPVRADVDASEESEEIEAVEAAEEIHEVEEAEAGDEAQEIPGFEEFEAGEESAPAGFEDPAPIAAEQTAEEIGGVAFDAPSVAAQQRAILERFDGEVEPAPASPAGSRRAARAEVVPMPQRAAGAGGRKAAFTLRLDAERHLRLRLACAVTRHSAQQIVARALDEALAGIPEIEALASQVPAKAGRAGAKRN